MSKFKHTGTIAEGLTPSGASPRITGKFYQEERKMEEKKIEKLYALLSRAEREKDQESAATLRWAIFELEQK